VLLVNLPSQDELDWGKENFIQIRRIREVHWHKPGSLRDAWSS
jgi:hypothetical protein